MKYFPFVLFISCLLLTSVHALGQTPEETEAALDSVNNKKEQYIILLKAASDQFRYYPEESLDFAERAIQLSKDLNDRRRGAEAYSVKGFILINQNKFSQAPDPLLKAIRLRMRYVKREVGQNKKLAQDYNFLGIAYSRTGENEKADKAYQSQLKYALASPSNVERAKAAQNVGQSYLRKKNYKEALNLLKQAKVFAEKANLKRTLADIEKDIATANDLLQSSLSAQEYQRELNAVSSVIDNVQDSLTTAIETNEVLMSEKEYLELETAKKEAELNAEKEAKRFAEREKKRIEQEKLALEALQEVRNRNFQIILLASIFGGILLLWIALTMWQRAIERKKAQEEIQQEKERADRLLENILPARIAQELKEKNLVEPVEHQKVTIMFTDFKSFTRLAAGMSPKELLEQLEYAFHNFDIITTKYGLEKIKTIGDAYMAVAGLVREDPYQGINAVAAGMEMQEFMNRWNAEQRQRGEQEWKLRVGIHTGKVVAGVIGEKKFAYDVWGDDVNVASRMESSSEPGKVNISEATFQEVSPYIQVEPKRTVPIKNKGDIGMYFVKRITARRSSPQQEAADKAV